RGRSAPPAGRGCRRPRGAPGRHRDRPRWGPGHRRSRGAGPTAPAAGRRAGAAGAAGRASSGQVGPGVDRLGVDPDLEVEVVPGRVPGAAHEAEDVALVQLLALGGADPGLVAVESGDAVAVVDDDGVAVAVEPAGVDD